MVLRGQAEEYSYGGDSWRRGRLATFSPTWALTTLLLTQINTTIPNDGVSELSEVSDHRTLREQHLTNFLSRDVA